MAYFLRSRAREVFSFADRATEIVRSRAREILESVNADGLTAVTSNLAITTGIPADYFVAAIRHLLLDR